MELALLGYFVKPHGLKGELLLRQEAEIRLKSIKALFVDLDDSKAPYFVRSLRQAEKGLIVLLEDITSVEQAGVLAGRKVYAETAVFKKERKRVDLTEYEIVDKTHGSLGKIIRVDDSGAQVLVTVHYGEKEIMLPFADDLIEKIDRRNKRIHYSAPEGLIEMYLED